MSTQEGALASVSDWIDRCVYSNMCVPSTSAQLFGG